MTRSASTSASSTSCVTSSTVRGSRAQGVREPGLQLLARERVERGERLVEAQDRLAREQRAQEGDALAHPAGQLVGPGALEAGESEGGERLVRARARRRAVLSLQTQRQRGVVERPGPGEQAVALGHEDGGRGLHGAGLGRLQPAGELEERRLAAAAGADDRDDLAGTGAQRHVVEHAQRAEDLADALQEDAPLVRRPAHALPPRALPHRFKGSAPGTWRYLSRAFLPAPLVCLGSTVPARDFARTASIAQAGRRPPTPTAATPIASPSRRP